MPEAFIGPARPIFNIEDKPRKKAERLIAGSKSNGMVIDITKEGLELNAYYTGFNEDVKFSVIRQPVSIPWDELDKIKGRLQKTGKKVAIKDRIENEIDPDYLKTLPVVTINGRRYHIDPERRERRAVEKPEEVWKF